MARNSAKPRRSWHLAAYEHLDRLWRERETEPVAHRVDDILDPETGEIVGSRLRPVYRVKAPTRPA